MSIQLLCLLRDVRISSVVLSSIGDHNGHIPHEAIDGEILVFGVLVTHV